MRSVWQATNRGSHSSRGPEVCQPKALAWASDTVWWEGWGAGLGTRPATLFPLVMTRLHRGPPLPPASTVHTQLFITQAEPPSPLTPSPGLPGPTLPYTCHTHADTLSAPTGLATKGTGHRIWTAPGVESSLLKSPRARSALTHSPRPRRPRFLGLGPRLIPLRGLP